MFAKLWRSLALAAVATIGLTATNEAAAQTAYAWADQPTVNGYMPNTLYSFNPRGDVNIMRQGTGRYTVVFEKFGVDPDNNPGSGGHAQVSAYGGADRCAIGSWNYQRPNFTVNITCFRGGTANTPVDTRFTVLATFEKVELIALPMMVGTPEIDALQADITDIRGRIANLGERILVLEAQ